MSTRKSYLILLSGTLLWCLLLILPPLVSVWAGPSNAISEQVYKFFLPICHQYDTRSLHLFGYKLAVCARCFGIYAGFFIGATLFVILRRRSNGLTIFWWMVAVLPILVDVVTDAIGLHSCTLASRTATGLFFGIIAACLLVPYIIDGLSNFAAPKLTNHGEYNELKA